DRARALLGVRRQRLDVLRDLVERGADLLHRGDRLLDRRHLLAEAGRELVDVLGDDALGVLDVRAVLVDAARETLELAGRLAGAALGLLAGLLDFAQPPGRLLARRLRVRQPAAKLARVAALAARSPGFFELDPKARRLLVEPVDAPPQLALALAGLLVLLAGSLHLGRHLGELVPEPAHRVGQLRRPRHEPAARRLADRRQDGLGRAALHAEREHEAAEERAEPGDERAAGEVEALREDVVAEADRETDGHERDEESLPERAALSELVERFHRRQHAR